MDKSKVVLDGLHLFLQSPWHSKYSLTEFVEYWVYPLMHGKARLFYDANDNPIGLVTWCWMTKQEGELFLAYKLRMSPEIYARDTGEELWGIEFITPYGHASKIMREMQGLFHNLYGNGKAHFKRYKQRPAKRHTRRF